MHSKGYILYQLPFGRGRQFLNSNALVDAIIGGWQVSDTLIIQSGQPFTAVMKADNSYSLAGSNFAWYPNVDREPEACEPRCPISGSMRRHSQFRPREPSAMRGGIN